MLWKHIVVHLTKGGRGRRREREPVKNFLEKVTHKRGLNAGKTEGSIFKN